MSSLSSTNINQIKIKSMNIKTIVGAALAVALFTGEA